MLNQRWMFKSVKYKNLGKNWITRNNIHCWSNITNIIPHSSDDDSLEPKRYSVDCDRENSPPPGGLIN